MHIESTFDQKLVITTGPGLELRILFGAISLFFIYKTGLIFSLILKMHHQYGSWGMPGISLLLYAGIAVFFIYFASNKRVYTISPQGITDLLGPRVYAFFSLKEKFIPATEIKGFVITQEKSRKLGGLYYGITALLRTDNKTYGIVGIKTEKEAIELVQKMKEKLGL